MRQDSELQLQIIFDFYSKNRNAIRSLAAKFSEPAEDIKQYVALFILERGNQFDAREATFEAYVLGHVRKILRGKSIDAMRFARSLDDASSEGKILRTRVEDVAENEEENRAPRKIPGTPDLLSLADAASGKSAQEIAERLKITRRRVNQKRQQKEREAEFQFSLNFCDWNVQ